MTYRYNSHTPGAFSVVNMISEISGEDVKRLTVFDKQPCKQTAAAVHFHLRSDITEYRTNFSEMSVEMCV